MREAIMHERPASRAGAKGRLFRQRRRRSSEGYSVIELLLVLIVSLIIGAIAIVATRSAMASYQLSAAVDSATGAIQGARYQAIMHGYPYQVAFDNTKNTFQVLSEAPPATLFVPTGSAVPVSTVPINLSAATTLQFKPNGTISATVGTMTFSISYHGTNKTLTVSKYGSITVQ
jgi:Tfp pilus assembly protein FimT